MPLTQDTQGSQILAPKKNKTVIARDWGQGKQSFCLSSTELRFAKMKKFWTVVIRQLHGNANALNATELDTQVWSTLRISLQ